jgi:putative transposase
MNIRKTYKYRLYTHHKSDKHLHQIINTAGMIWNHALALQKRYYRLTGKYISLSVLKHHIAHLRMHTTRYGWWKGLGSQAVQEICERLDKAYQRFFAKQGGLPRFKKVKKFKSFVLKQSGWKSLDDKNPKYNGKGELIHAIGYIQILGRTYKFIKHRKMNGTIKTLTIKRDNLGGLWICFSVEENVNFPDIASTGQIGGFDFGLKTFLTNEQGHQSDSPQFLRTELASLRRLNRSLSRKQAGSRNRQRAKHALARAHLRIADKRQAHHYQLAHELCDQYQAVMFEDLNMDAMKRLWGRKVSDLGFAQFLDIMRQVAFQRGVIFGQCQHFEPSTKTCSGCGHRQPMTLSERSFHCQVCGLSLDRDHNAAINILHAGASALGLEVRQTPSGAALFEATCPRL